MSSGVKLDGTKEAVLTEKTEHVDDNQTDTSKEFLGTGKSSEENITEMRDNKELESNISDEQDLSNTSPLTEHKSAAEYEKELRLLNQWYRLDENYVPSVYSLQPISTFYKDIFSKDPVRKQQAKSKWLSSFQKLHKILQEYASIAVGQDTASMLLKTVLQQEVDQGLCVHGSPEDHCHCFKRDICDLQFNLSRKQASKYIDVHPLKPEINIGMYEAHQNFIKSIYTRLHHTNIYEKSISWGKRGIDPASNRSRAYYLERLCNDFQKIVITHFSRLIKSKKIPDVLDARRRKQILQIHRDEEILEHIQHCQGLDLRVIIRFIGVTGESRNVRLVLLSLCYQIADIYQISINLSEDFEALVQEFASLLEFATKDKALLISLDGLDELSEEYGADLSWIPTKLPENVYFMVSTSTESNCSCLKALKEIGVEQNILQIPSLTSTEINHLITCWLKRDCRILSTYQQQLLIEACVACPLPLYMFCAYKESFLWTSFSLETEVYLPPDLSKMYSWLMEKMEKNHGEQVIKRMAAYITLSKNGIALEELLDLLSLDETVMQEITKYQKVSVLAFPQVLWMKIQKDFGEHLVEQRSENTYVFSWAHSFLKHICMERYLKTCDLQLSLHAAFADYYLGHKAPKINGEMTTSQPLAWVLKKESKVSYVFNLRKLVGTSYHLIKSNNIPMLITECLFNYEFLLHKACALSVISIEEDLKAAASVERTLLDLNLLSETLKLSKKVLLKDPYQLASQLIGRLHQIVAADKPVAPGDPKKYQHLPALLSQCQESSTPVLVPSTTCLLAPGGLLCELLPGHMDKITAVAETQKDLMVVTASQDGTLKYWDLNTGKATLTLCGAGKNIGSITVCQENRLVAVTENNSFKIWDLSLGKVIYKADGFPDTPILTSAMNGQFLLVFFDGSLLVKVFDLTDSCQLLHEAHISAEDDAPVHKNHSVLVSKNSVKDYVLCAYRSGKEAMVFSAKKGQVTAKLTSQESVVAVEGVAITKEYFLVIFRCPFMGQQDIVHIELFSVGTFVYTHTLKGCCNDFISTYFINHLGSHLVAFSSIPNTSTTEIIIWNLESEEHKHLAKLPSVPVGGVCSDLHYCLAFCDGENCLQSWNLASKINDQSLTVTANKPKKISGIQDIVTIQNYPRQVQKKDCSLI
ncbi:NACHT domain- and WD repeat-containing protein 1 [Alligator mississippiensis]|uniref:NACHT domain- and WD repeat-containing protein 1 n=1 Tax=Alligator mississippiensis TaxID=8496 RepID=UPI002877B714|nr:NACHT domain- and WD repeat-containing protein 1 [Alligator mississippiensis]